MNINLANNQNVSDEQKILDNLPSVNKGEGEEHYIARCIPSLYPDTYDQQQAASHCADYYENKVNMGLKKQIMKVDMPKSGESEEHYLGYCIAEEIKNGREQSQAAAICYSNYRQDMMSKVKDTNGRVMAKIAYNTDFKGINLINLGINSDACWEGYIQVGTKILDGKEVPDCRGPIEAGINLADYPWEQCIADMTERYDAEAAPKICGAIKAKYGSKE